jgi:hypothetical protein
MSRLSSGRVGNLLWLPGRGQFWSEGVWFEAGLTIRVHGNGPVLRSSVSVSCSAGRLSCGWTRQEVEVEVVETQGLEALVDGELDALGRRARFTVWGRFTV